MEHTPPYLSEIPPGLEGSLSKCFSAAGRAKIGARAQNCQRGGGKNNFANDQRRTSSISVGFLMLTRCEAAASKSVPLLICTFMFYIHPRTLPDVGLSILVFNRQLQKRERSGKEYVCFTFV